MTRDLDVLDLPPADRMKALRADIQWVHMGSVEIDYRVRIHIFSHSIDRRVVLSLAPGGGSAAWDFATSFRATEGKWETPREKNEEITRILKLAQESIIAAKYGRKAAEALEFRHKFLTPTLGRHGSRFIFFREVMPADFEGYFR